MISIQGGAFLRARANPVVVVVVKTQRKSDSSVRKAFASISAMFTSPTLTACSQVDLCFDRQSRNSRSYNPTLCPNFSR